MPALRPSETELQIRDLKRPRLSEAAPRAPPWEVPPAPPCMLPRLAGGGAVAAEKASSKRKPGGER